MDSLVGYGSDDDNETERVSSHSSVGQGSSQPARRRDDDTNYDAVNMELSEESQGESEQEGQSSSHNCPDRPERLKRSSFHGQQDNERSNSDDSRERDRRDRDQDRKDRRRESPARQKGDRDRADRDKDRRSPRRDDKYRSDRSDRGRGSQESSRRGLLGDRPDDRSGDSRVPALMDLKPFGGEPPPGMSYGKSQDARDAVSPRFVDRERRERERERGRDKERHGRRSEERRSGHRSRERRSRSRGAAYPPPTYTSSSNERRSSPPSGDYRPSSYKVNKKLKVMEKMGLQIKTPDGSMATAQQLRAASQDSAAPTGLPAYFNASALNSNKMKDQKRKLLWSNKTKTEAEEAAKWSGTRFAQDSDGKQVSKFMRLMGIKEPTAVKPEVDTTADPNKKQEELFQAMQAQYEVARATTHTMRGVGLGFQRGQF